MTLQKIKKILSKHCNKRKAKILQSFFKTGPGQYAESDIFLGITVPQIRKIANQYQDLTLNQVKNLLKSPFHEERLLALLILVLKFKGAKALQQKQIYQVYLKYSQYVNNWDLVDLTAPHILGSYLFNRDKKILYKLARAKNFWKRRIAILATFYFIKNRQYDDTLKIAKILLADQEDLIQKAVGWMLREIGKRDLAVEESFLKEYYQKMPRTMLRYAIERFPENKRQAYLRGRI